MNTAKAACKMKDLPPGSCEANELDLVERLLAGDESSFAALVDRYHMRLLRLAQMFVTDRGIAEEIVQETWLAIVKGLPSFERRSALNTWMFRILVNRAKSRAGREDRYRSFSAGAAADGDPTPAVDPGRFTPGGMWAVPPRLWDEDSPDKLLLRKEARQCIDRAIAELPTNQRLIVTLRDIEGLASDEVCNVLEIRETNQRVLLHRARSKLREVLERYFREE